jgi:hypothetical protein
MKRLAVTLVLLLLVVMPALAQRGPHFVQIVRAEYGGGNRWADVTERVRSLVSGDFLNFRVDNETLGGDPWPDHVKTLRLQLRERDGDIRQITFQERETVSLRVGGGARRWGGYSSDGLRITRAEYGDGRRFLDVTQQLSSLIQGDKLNLRVTNETMGGDPAEEHHKKLTVWYTFNGRPAQVTVDEKSYLTLPGPNDYYVDRLQITRAQYGAGNRFADVTERLRSMVQDGSLSTWVTNSTMGVDPAEGKRKQLTVYYTLNGRRDRIVVNEGDYLNLPGR